MSQTTPPSRVQLISHPATRAQKAGIFPKDEPLDEDSLALLAGHTWDLPQSTRVLASPEQRTLQMAKALSWNATVAAELRDCDFGLWSGKSLEVLQAEDLSGWLSDITAKPHGGESFYDLIKRVGHWLDEQCGHGSTVVVTHATIIRAAIVHALVATPHKAFLSIEIAPMTITDLRFSGDLWRLRSVGVPAKSWTTE